MGRFLEGDPLAVGSSTPFDYGGGSPVGWKDPGGYQEQAAAPSEVVIVRSITEDEVASAYAPALEAINDSQKAGDMGLSSTDVEAIAKGVEGLKAAARDGKAKVDPSHQAFWDVDVSGNRVRNQTGGVMDSKTGEITLYSFPHEPSNDPIIEQDPGIHEGTHYNQWKADPVGFAKAYEVGGNTSVETVNNAMDKVRIEAEADRAGVAGGHVMSALAKGRMSKLEPLKNPSGFGSAKGAYDAWKARVDGLGLEATLILEM